MKKNILVIGASSGIGFDLVKALLSEGHTVYCGARRIERLEPLKQLGAHIFEVDVRDEVQVKHIVHTMHHVEGLIDIVYANAGYPIAGPVEETSIERVEQQFNTNVFGAARIARAALPVMRQQGYGRIVFTTSIAGRVSSSMNSWYSSSKHALNGMVKGLAQEVAEFNIQVSTVEPGCVQTELPDLQLQDMLDSTTLPEYKEIVNKSHRFLDRAYKNGSDTTSTVKTLLTAGFTHSPKLSYRSTLDAKIMNTVQNIIGESRMGKLILSIIKRS